MIYFSYHYWNWIYLYAAKRLRKSHYKSYTFTNQILFYQTSNTVHWQLFIQFCLDYCGISIAKKGAWCLGWASCCSCQVCRMGSQNCRPTIINLHFQRSTIVNRSKGILPMQVIRYIRARIQFWPGRSWELPPALRTRCYLVNLCPGICDSYRTLLLLYKNLWQYTKEWNREGESGGLIMKCVTGGRKHEGGKD